MATDAPISKKWHEVTFESSSLWQNKSELYGNPLTACYHFAKKTELLNLLHAEAKHRPERFFRWCPNPKAVFWQRLLSILLFLLLYSCSSILFLSFHGFWQINLLRGKGINFRTVMEDTTSYLGKAESINSRNRKLLGR